MTLRLKGQRKEMIKQKRRSIRTVASCRGRTRVNDKSQNTKIIILIAIEIIKELALPGRMPVFVNHATSGMLATVGLIVQTMSFGIAYDLYIKRIETLIIVMGFKEVTREWETHLVIKRQMQQHL
jgi:hypothetical protein